MKISPRGFRFRFTAPLAASATDPSLWIGERYTYAYHEAYGSPELSKTPLAVSKVTLSADAQEADVELEDFRPAFIYDFDLTMLHSSTGEALLNPHVAYTANRLPKP